MNPESLDLSIQTALSALFPPFEATAPIVISQLFRTIEERYGGDALQCLLDFLIPSKHLLESVQQAACAGYSDVVFRCEGWPLCLHDKTVIQLAPVNPLLLRPGDFYLQVEPFGDQAARIVLKTLLEEGCREVEETPISETSYPCLFSEDWLNDINEGRHGIPLTRCLLCTDQGVIKLPWAKIAIPEFLDKPRKPPASRKAQVEPKQPPTPSHFNSCTLPADAVILSKQEKMSASLRHAHPSSRLVRVEHERRVPKLGTKPLIKPVGWVSPNTWESPNYKEVEGDYVDLVDLYKRTESVEKQRDNIEIQSKSVSPQPVRPPPPIPVGRSASCGLAAQHSGDRCAPGNQLKQELLDPNLKCRYRDSYMVALSNPVAFEKGSIDLLSTLEEGHHCEEPDSTNQNLPESHRDHFNNVCSELCRCKLKNSERTPHLPCSSEWENLRKDSLLNETVQLKQMSHLKGTAGDAHPVSDVTLAACEAGQRAPRQMGEAVKSGKHKVKVRSLSTVSETPMGSPALYQLNLRSHSDVSPQIISSMIQSRKHSLVVDAEAGKSDKQKCWKKESRSSKGETRCNTSGSPSLQVQLMVTSCTSNQSPQTPESAFNGICSLIQLGIIFLPGSRDKNGRAVLEVHSDRDGWMSPLVSAQSVCELLLYFHSIPRKDIRELGMTLVINARKRPPPPHLYKALLMAQEQALHAVHCIILLMDKETWPRPEKHPGLQMDIVTSTRALNKTVDNSQLTCELGGTFIYSHLDWLQFHRKLTAFMDELRGADSLLQSAIKSVESGKHLDTTQEIQQSIQEQRVLMKKVLEDARMLTLQREGGALLARMKREEFRFPQSEDFRDAVESATCLYNQVEEKLHTLVMRSNMSLQHLEFLLRMRETEADIITAGAWFSTEGEQKLKDSCTAEETLTGFQKTFQDFNAFLTLAKDKRQHAQTLVREADEILEASTSSPSSEVFRTLVSTFKSNVEDFMSRAEGRHKELDSILHGYKFCEEAAAVANECGRFLEQVERGCVSSPTLTTVQLYKERLSAEFSSSHFQAVKVKASAQGSGASGLMRVWNAAWARSQEVKQRLEGIKKGGKDKNQIPQTAAGNPREENKKETQTKTGKKNELREAESSLVPEPGSHTKAGKSVGGESCSNAVACTNRDLKLAKSTNQNALSQQFPEQQQKNAAGAQVVSQMSDSRPDGRRGPREHHRSEADLRTHSTKGSEEFPLHPALGRSLSEGSRVMSTSCFLPAVISHRRCQSRTHSLDESLQPNPDPHQDATSPKTNHGERRGSKHEGESVERGVTTQNSDGSSPTQTLRTPTEDYNNSLLKVRKILEELLSTEREYVKALGYVREHYFPELERADVPQDLRGQRGNVFGNLEKLHDFHCHHFRDELEACMNEPFRVGRCFLRHRDSFALYALYSKNKPQSDSLLINYGQAFFKQKQLQLGDKMDLWSYLLKPVQRISKYSLLLQDIMRECGPAQAREIAEIKAAMEVVNFQLRHGNNLLAMDAIHQCDVNLKEQGQLLRQDEFLVTFRKKKCYRHIFLFQELVLFSKTRNTDVGNDTYIYKQSFKTSDIGMTQNSGESGLCFEIWFRKRKSQDTYTLQAASREVKEAWTKDLERILWEQAIHNKDVRMQERVFLGIGNKPFIDIQPSEAAIHDRAVNYVLMGREYKALSSCGAKRELLGARPKSLGSDSSPASSFSSGRGSLSPEGFAHVPKRRVVSSGGYVSSPSSLEEHDLDQESESHNLLLDSSESSGESVSGFSCSSHSYRSALGGEVDDGSSVKSYHPTEALTVAPRPAALVGSAVKTPLPVAHKSKPKPLHRNKDPSSDKDQEDGVGKSTEV